MKTNELRIGNWYGEYSIPKQADAFLIGRLAQIEKANKIAIDVSPIPLTEEWLLKFGFKQSGYFTFLGDKYLRFKIGRMGAYTIDKKEFIFEVNEHDLCEIQYVHQLQNLYFALTGEELTHNNQ